MVYLGAEYSSEDLFQELKRQVRDENIRSFDEYSDLVDNLIEEKKSYGFLTDEDDLVQLRHTLELRWNEIQSEMFEV
ncbi:MAG: hypothetical protein US63_C0035G0006 [Candidatus Moranbacteria bacterium GW2011_GWC2_37_8]|nr:MAG: hypothetical protein US63_C0035G0006 [Candidatus Moranbacteria bacterium GW2011_GWC2_37_8]KKQ61876.1 MAG: hypothetical protein US82_C0019G0014 [Parcubacteria group bacterium GW2011_GWC1_38_22]KKQ81370.1 MAG: hypothetical protein UT03_C0004G0009 [Candidatus Moranbacteria bacterium GW2011_GWD2_38_7]